MKQAATDLAEIARELAPRIAGRAAEAERGRRLPKETARDFRDSGLFRALQPRRFGGGEAPLPDFYEAVMQIARVCGSSGWVLGVVGVHDWQLALFDDRAQQDVWGDDPTVRISSSYAPTGEVTPVEGGFRIRGTWSFSSGSDLCDWVFLGGLTPRDDGGIELRTFLLPRSDYRVEDNWHVMGLRGTGSHDIVVEGAFVPEYRTQKFADAYSGRTPGREVNPGSLYALPFGCVFCTSVAAPAVGVARGAIDAFVSQASTRISAADGSSPSRDPVVLARLGESGSEVAAAEEGIRRPWREMLAWSEAHPGETVPIPMRADCRSSITHAVEWSLRATQRIFQVAGSRAIFEHNPLQRALRDAIAIRAHAMNHLEKSGSMRARDSIASLADEFFI